MLIVWKIHVYIYSTESILYLLLVLTDKSICLISNTVGLNLT